MRAEDSVGSGEEHMNDDVGVTGLFWWWEGGETDLRVTSKFLV